MAWIKNEESEITWGDTRGEFGGFLRAPDVTERDSTGVGPVSSPNGTKFHIVVTNLGTVDSVAV